MSRLKLIAGLDDLANAVFVARRLAYFADLPLAGHAFFKLEDSRQEGQRSPFSTRLGAVNPRGLRKPVFNALALAARLGETRLAVEQSGDWAERDVLAGQDFSGKVSILLVSGGREPSALPSATVEITVTGLDASPYQVDIYRIDADHGNPSELEDEIAAAYASTWDIHLGNARQALLNAGYPPDDVEATITGLQTDPQTTLSAIKDENPDLHAATVAALNAERPVLNVALEMVASQYNSDPRLALIPEVDTLMPVGGQATLWITLPGEGVLLVCLSH